MADRLEMEDEKPEKPPEGEQSELPPPPVASLKKVPDRRGEKIRNREKLVSSIGISKKYCPPITRRRMVKYQLVGKGTQVDNRLQGLDRTIESPYFGFSPHYTFRDMMENDLSKREKTMTYWAGGTETVWVDDPVSKKKVRHLEPKVGTPEMIFGEVTVNTLEDYNRYVWWELHPQNKSNKWRTHGALAVFERVDSDYRSPHLANIRLDMLITAEQYLIKLKPDQRINLASALTNPTVATDINPQELLLTLRMRARTNPEEILFTKPDEIGSVKIAAIHALDMGILEFEADRESYYYSDDESPMVVVPVGNDPFNTLVNFLHDDPEGQKYFDRIKSDLDFWF